jgi:hypothetical protein
MTRSRKGNSSEPSLRDRLTSAFVEALEKDWTEHGPSVIAAVREQAPAKYAELIVRLVPIEPNLVAPGDFSQCDSEEDIAKRLLAQVGIEGDAVAPHMVQAAIAANTTFINELQRIAGGF